MGYETLQVGPNRWTNIDSLTKVEIERLQEDYKQFHPLAIEDCLSLLERPKLDDYEDHLFIVMQFPLWDQSKRLTRSGEVDIFVGQDFVVTVHDGRLKPLNTLFENLRNNEELREECLSQGGGRMMHLIVDRLTDYLFPIISKVNTSIHAIEEEIFSEELSEIVQEISVVRRDIISLRRIVRPQVALVANLEKINRPFIRDELDDYFGDILDHMIKVRDILDENAEVIAGLADTAATLSSHRTNEVMRILTVISVVILPMTLISGIFGMNVPLPWQKKAWSLGMVLLLMFGISGGMMWYFRQKRWL